MKIQITTKFKETEIGAVSEEWDVLELEKFAELIKDTYLPNKSEELLYIGLEHIDQQTLSLNSIGKSSDVKSNKFRFKDGDILFGKLRPYFRKVYRPKFSGICSTDIWVVRSKKGFDQGWLFYLLASEDFINFASGGSGGTRMPRADWHHLKSIKWSVPKINEQKQIAEILSSLDDKIELNCKINDNLEKIASSLFKYWFVDFEFPNEEGKPYKSSGGKMIDSELGEIPDGWRASNFDDIAKITSGKRPGEKKENMTVDFNIPLLGASSIMGYVKEYLYNEPILITGRVGTHGIIQKVDYPCWPSDNTLVIKSKFLEFTNQVMKGFDFASLNRGSTQPLITQSDLKSIKIIISSNFILENFEQLVDPFIKIISDNKRQNYYLRQTRDFLLPRLMSGKIRVK